MRVPVKMAYLDCTSPAFPSGVIEDAEWDPERGAIYVRLPAKNVVVPFVKVREMTVVAEVAPPAPATKPAGTAPAVTVRKRS